MKWAHHAHFSVRGDDEAVVVVRLLFKDLLDTFWLRLWLRLCG